MDRRIHRTGTDRALEKLVDASRRGTDYIGNDGGRSGASAAVALGGREVESSVVMDLIVLNASRRRFHTIHIHFHKIEKKQKQKQNPLNSKKKIRSKKKSPSLFFLESLFSEMKVRFFQTRLTDTVIFENGFD